MPQVRLFSPAALHLLFLGVIVFGILTAGGNWSFNHGALFAGAGLLMMVFPPVAALPRGWWLLALGFVLALGGAFLPDAWFFPLSWRGELEALGLETGDQVVIQRRLALETGLVFCGTLLVGLWMVGQRVSAGGLRWVAVVFAMVVAAYAVLSLIFREELGASRSGGHFGFFPNRNHTATFLAMGAITGLGCLMQGIRERRAWAIALSLAATLACVWAVVGWSISRAGVVLVGVGALAWMAVLGPGYLGRHTRSALLILALAIGGGFLVADSQVKQRLTETVERMGPVGTGDEAPATPTDLAGVDFRVPTWLDTLGMIEARPWTGFGAGQFSFVFPQYRDRTAVADRTRHLHPESDWLWLVAEAGVPAAVLLAALAAAAMIGSWRGLSVGRSRAIRAGCLVGALLLGFHSLFDVPGHRVPLAWSGALLLGLSLPPAGDRGNPNGVVARLAGAVVLAGGLWLLFAQGSASHEPVMTRGERAVAEALDLYRLDRTARAEGRLPPADPADDPLEKALVILAEATRDLPLDLRLHHLEGVIAIQFDGREEVVERAFAIEQALDPAWPGLPLRQATAWAPVDPQRAAGLSGEVRERAARLDAKELRAPHGAESWGDEAQRRIAELARKFRTMKPAATPSGP